MSRYFRVVVSCCPSEEEKAWRVEEDNSLHSSTGGESYSFDHVLTEKGGHEELYEGAVSPLVASALGGHDAFVVAYGLPRTGKTHTVFGSPGQARVQREGRGIVARIGQQVFDAVSSDTVCRVSASFCHVFEDGRVTDLFDSRRRRLDLVEDRSGANAYSAPSLTSHPVTSPLDLARLTEKANLMRNASGCRRDSAHALSLAGPQLHLYKPHCSHAVISLLVERLQRRGSEGGGEGDSVTKSQITVVDLAGHGIGLVQSDQPCPDSGILILHQIMTTLPSRGIVATAGLFQQSSLTKLLKPFLGGNSEALLVGTVSLSEASLESSTRCLQLLQEACKIKNYRRHTASPLRDSALGKTLQQISDLRREVCATVGVTDELSELWEAGRVQQGSNYIEIRGQRYGDLSASCCSLLEKVEKLEAHILRNGVSNKKPNLVQSRAPVIQLPSRALTSTPAPPATSPSKHLLHKSPHTTNPLSPQSVASHTPQQSHSLSSSSLDTSSSDSDQEQTKQPTMTGPPPPPLRGIPHVKPDSTFVPPRPTGNLRGNVLRPSSGQSHDHSLASCSQVSSTVSGWSEATPSLPPHRHPHHHPSTPTSSVQHVPTLSHPHPSHPHPSHPHPSHPHPSHIHPSHPPSSSHVHQPSLPLRGPLRTPLPVQPVRLDRPVRPVLPLTLRPPRPLFPTVRPHPPLAIITAQSPAARPRQPAILPLPTPDSHSPPHPSTPGSLTPNAGSPTHTPSPSPSPLPPRAQPSEHTHSPSQLPPSQLPPSLLPPPQLPPSLLPPPQLPPSLLPPPQLPPSLLPPSQLPPLQLPPIAQPPIPPTLTSTHHTTGDHMSSSSSSLTLTDSDLSQEARDTFDPVIRNRALSMLRTAPPYNGCQMTSSHSLPTVPPYQASQYSPSSHPSQQQVREGREGGERRRGDMSEYTSREEIHIAAMEGVKSSQLKKLAIRYGVDYRDHGGRTPLMYAVLGNQPRMCDTLLSLGAKVNTQDSTGLTPLLWATFQAKPQCMKILLRHGADPLARDAEGRSVFHWAVKSPDIHALKALQRHATPTIVNTADKDGLTPLHWAVLCNQPAHTHLLLTNATADVSIQDSEGRTALTHAVLNGSSSCIKVILEVCESAVNQRDEKGRTALHYACAEGSTDCVRAMLTARSCDIHSQDNRGTTPLHWAAAANQPSILQLLLRRGADRSLGDNDNLTAVEHAEVRGHTECVHILHNYGLRRPSSALSVASQVSVHATPPSSLDEHGHVLLSLPHRRFSLSQSSLPRSPADGQAHPDDSGTDHTHWVEPQNPEQGCNNGEGVRRKWWRVMMCGCSRHNVVMPAPDT